MATTAATLQVVVGADITGALRGLTQVSSSLTSTTRSFLSSAASTAVGFGTAALGLDALGSATDLLKKAMGVGLANEMEGLTARFEAMLGSTEAAGDMLAFLRKRADETPYGFTELARSAASLVPIMKRTGAPMDAMLNTVMAMAASDPAQGLEGAAFALREMAGGDFQSLKDRFEIDVRPIKELMKVGVPGLTALNQVLEQNGISLALVEKRAATTEGRFSTFKDLLDSVFIEAGKPILAGLGLELDRAGGLVTANLPALKELWRTMGTNIAGALNATGESLGTIFQTATNLSQVHGLPFLDSLISASELRLGEVFGADAAKGFHGFVDAIKGIPGVLGSIQKFFMTDFPNAVGTVTTAADGIKKTFTDLFAQIQRDFGLFVISLSTLPGPIGDSFKDAAAHFRQQMGTPFGAAGTQWSGVDPIYGPKLLAGAYPAPTPGSGMAAGEVHATTNVNVYGANFSDPSDIERFAESIGGAVRKNLDAAGEEAPGA